MPGELAARDPADQHLGPGSGRRGRGQVPGAAGSGEADHRGGQPGRGLLIGGKTRQDAVGGIQRGGGGFVPASGQRDRGGDQVRLRLGPGLAVRHARELAGQGRAAPRLDDLADRQLVDDDAGGERPVAGLGGVPHRVGELAVPLVPPGGPPVQRGHPVRMLAPQLQPQHLGEQRVVAVPPGPDRLDKPVRVRQGRQDCRGLLVAGQFAGGLGADLLQDGRAQQDVPDLRRLGVENLRHQVAGQGAVVGDQLGDELVRVGMSAHRDRGQAQAGRPALGPPGQALQRVRRQRDAVPGQQQAGFGDGERQVAGPDLGQLAGQPVAVQRQQRVHPRGRPPGAGPALAFRST